MKCNWQKQKFKQFRGILVKRNLEAFTKPDIVTLDTQKHSEQKFMHLRLGRVDTSTKKTEKEYTYFLQKIH